MSVEVESFKSCIALSILSTFLCDFFYRVLAFKEKEIEINQKYCTFQKSSVQVL